MYKIAIIYSSYPEMEEVAKEYMQKKGYYIKVFNGVLDKAVELALKCEAEGFDIIISRGATGALINKYLNIPVVNIDITNFDIFKTLYKAREYGNKIAFFQYNEKIRERDYIFIRQALNISEDNLEIYNFKDDFELNKKMSKAKSADVVVGIGNYIIEVAKKHRVETLMVHSTKEAIYNAFDQAKSMIELKNKYFQLNDYFNAFALENFAGLIFLDNKNKIKYLSDKIPLLLGVDQGLLLDEDISNKFNDIPILKRLGENENNYIVNHKGNDLIINKINLWHSKEVIGKAIKIEYYEKNSLYSDNKKIKINSLGLKAKYYFDDMLGQSDNMKVLIRKAKSYSKTDASVLITGESGTGKEVLANSIHNESHRKKDPFVAVNCATLPKTLIESELFGYEEGAFTGAKTGGKVGLFELANGGTIFLDEISEIPISAQAQLLRVLEEKTIMKVGGNKIIPIDVRVIAATNADLSERIELNQFRMDLFYRLNVLSLRIPPLRERKEDIPLLIENFIKKQDNKKKINIPDVLITKLMKRKWAGNVRELKNFVDKFIILSQNKNDEFALLDELLYESGENTKKDSDYVKDENLDNGIFLEVGTLKEMETQIIKELFDKYGHNRTNLAKKLGISRTSLWTKLKEIEEK